MRRLGLPVSIYLHQGGHGGGPPEDMVNRWFSHYLYGVENGVRQDAAAWIVPNMVLGATTPFRQSSEAAPFPSFPVPTSVRVTLYPAAGGRGVGRLALSPAAQITENVTDSAGADGSANASLAQSPNRLLYATATLSDTVHLSGTARVTLRVASSKPAANLTVWLVTLPFDSTRRGSQSRVGVLARGWADIQNHRALTAGGDYNSKQPGEPLVPGTFYDVTFDLEPNDQIIPPGKRLAVMVMSSDEEFTLWPRPGTQLSIDLSRSSFAIPIVGSVTALQKAGAMVLVP
jgi:X-Pro dipeptidyl-peptidase